MNAPKYATTGERITARVNTVAAYIIAAAALGIALIAGVFIGITIGIQPPVVVKVEPTAVERQAQADAEIAAYNRGLDAGKFIGCDPADIERKTR